MARVVDHAEHEPPFVGGLVGADQRVGSHGPRAHLVGLAPEDRGGGEVDAELPDREAEQRHVDDHAAAGALAVEQRGCDPTGEHRPTGCVAHRASLHDHRALRRGEDVADAAARPVRHRVEAALVGVGSLLALPVALGVDEAGVHRPEVLGIRAQLGPRRGQEVGDEHVGASDEPVERLAAVGCPQVEGDPALVAVVQLPEEVDVAGVGDEARAHDGPERVTGRPLDLHHVGAPVAEHGRAAGYEPVLGQLHDPDPVEHSHGIPLACRPAAGASDPTPRFVSLAQMPPARRRGSVADAEGPRTSFGADR